MPVEHRGSQESTGVNRDLRIVRGKGGPETSSLAAHIRGGLTKSRTTERDLPLSGCRKNLGKKQTKGSRNDPLNASKGPRAAMPRVWGDLASGAEQPWETKGVLRSPLSADVALAPRTGGRATARIEEQAEQHEANLYSIDLRHRGRRAANKRARERARDRGQG